MFLGNMKKASLKDKLVKHLSLQYPSWVAKGELTAIQWKDDNGKMVAETVLNGVLERVVGTVNYAETDPTKRAEIDTNAPATDKKIEDRVFKVHNRYNPIPQGAIDNNPNLEQNAGY